MLAITVGMNKEALVLRAKDKTIFNYLQFTFSGEDRLINFREREIPSYDNCMMYLGDRFLANVSMENLELMIPAVNTKTTYLVEVRCGEESFYYSLDEAFFEENCVGIHITEFGETLPIIRSGQYAWVIKDGTITQVGSALDEKFKPIPYKEVISQLARASKLMNALEAHTFFLKENSLLFSTDEEMIEINMEMNSVIKCWRR